MSEIEIPLIPIRDVVVFPHAVVPISLKREKSVRALEESLLKDKRIFLVMQKKSEVDNPAPQDLYSIGTIALVKSVQRLPDGSVNIVTHGERRAKVKDFLQINPYFLARLTAYEEEIEINKEAESLLRLIIEQFRQALTMGKTIPMDMLPFVFETSDPLRSLDAVIFNLDLNTHEKQKLLEADSFIARLRVVSELLAREMSVLKTARRIQEKTAEEIGKNAKEAFLREQIRTIERELGIREEKEEFQELENKIRASGMTEEVQQRAFKELDRLKKMPSISPEVSYIRTYLDWLVEIPWKGTDEKELDIKRAQKVLDQDHYGLKKVKERILEYLAVQKMVGKVKGPILCFLGPPGVGKTSIGRSIARSLNRKFVKISLGGIRDEAEIRGHRRTYVGALPGRIIQGMKTAGNKNPVFMLDEIDKVGTDFRGDPSASLLEALDPEQNFAFSDHYLEVPYDLSDVMFVTTANILETIPPALQDRMEVVEFPGYTEEEKLHIGRDYLVPKQLETHGLKDKKINPSPPKGRSGTAFNPPDSGLKINFSEEVLKTIITYYTREAGVRNLEREIASICRKIAKAYTEGKKINQEINLTEVEKFLGPAKFRPWAVEKKDEVGVATGLAWTEAGGDVISVESTLMSGKGDLTLTGHLGDIMKESAQAALSYARSKADQIGVAEDFYKEKDIHVHVPAGAIPKDGPSAGITMAISLISSITSIPVKHEVGMTGEITLRGKVLEIGGIKEKVLAAHRAGLKTVILPEKNKKDLIEIPSKTKNNLKFIFVEDMDQVLRAALLHYPINIAKPSIPEEGSTLPYSPSA